MKKTLIIIAFILCIGGVLAILDDIDTVDRTNSASLGTASNGFAWQESDGAQCFFEVNSNQFQVTREERFGGANISLGAQMKGNGSIVIGEAKGIATAADGNVITLFSGSSKIFQLQFDNTPTACFQNASGNSVGECLFNTHANWAYDIRLVFNSTNNSIDGFFNGTKRFNAKTIVNADYVDKIGYVCEGETGNAVTYIMRINNFSYENQTMAAPVVESTEGNRTIENAQRADNTNRGTATNGNKWGQEGESGAADFSLENKRLKFVREVRGCESYLNLTQNITTNDRLVLDGVELPIAQESNIISLYNVGSGYDLKRMLQLQIHSQALKLFNGNLSNGTLLSVADNDALQINITMRSNSSFDIVTNKSSTIHNYPKLVERNNISIIGQTCDGETHNSVTGINTIDEIFLINASSIPDQTPPTIKFGINNTSPKINEMINISANLSDGIGLLRANITHNMSGVLTKINFTASGNSVRIHNETRILSAQGGAINFTVYITDTSNNVAQESIIITVGNTAPTSPTITNSSGATYGTNQVIGFSSSDADSDSLLYTISFNGARFSTTNQNFSTNMVTDGTYFLNISASDAFVNSSNSTGWNITFDGTAPVFNTFNVSNNSFTRSLIINLTFNATDAFGNNDSVLLYSNSVKNETRTFFNSALHNISINLTKEGNYTFILEVNDTLGNRRNSTSRVIILDITEPLIQNSSNRSINGAAISIGSTVNISAYISDLYLLSVIFSNNASGSWLNTSLSISGNGTYSQLISGFSSGSVVGWKTYITDFALNSVESNHSTFNVAIHSSSEQSSSGNGASGGLAGFFSYCGNGACEGSENFVTCSADCPYQGASEEGNETIVRKEVKTQSLLSKVIDAVTPQKQDTLLEQKEGTDIREQLSPSLKIGILVSVTIISILVIIFFVVVFS